MAHTPFLKKKLTHAILLGLTMGIQLSNTALTHAAEQEANAAIQQYNIPVGTVDQVLGEFGRRSGRMVAIDPALTEGLHSKGLKGQYTEQQALSILLVGTGLEIIAADNGGYRLRKASKLTEGHTFTTNPSSRLPEISVNATTASETATSPVPGYVAKRIASATKTDTSLLESPQSISIITREELTTRNVQRDGDALRYTAGVISDELWQ
ncbi:hypothetical protein LG201_05390 [Methylobacillus gramineus]|uniref:secretin and TonB N-terminal domain-containing protein n=1 Tax=Methylobacillus gramineus TaxID=755169 RepID=UPI001CFF8208|nr:STN domain-containing protein [Methylobacillus gramineus]MCB5184634.1 hypothetical protein [Methylobacillus gramineus]